MHRRPKITYPYRTTDDRNFSLLVTDVDGNRHTKLKFEGVNEDTREVHLEQCKQTLEEMLQLFNFAGDSEKYLFQRQLEQNISARDAAIYNIKANKNAIDTYQNTIKAYKDGIDTYTAKLNELLQQTRYDESDIRKEAKERPKIEKEAREYAQANQNSIRTVENKLRELGRFMAYVENPEGLAEVPLWLEKLSEITNTEPEKVSRVREAMELRIPRNGKERRLQRNGLHHAGHMLELLEHPTHDREPDYSRSQGVVRVGAHTAKYVPENERVVTDW